MAKKQVKDPLFPINGPALEEKEYLRLSSYIVSHYGIKLPPNKRVFLQARLLKRLRFLQLNSFKDYVNYLFSETGSAHEITELIDAVSTNKTDFFREPLHFDFLLERGLQDYFNLTHRNRLNIWSAGCSSGEEPYSLAISLKEHAGNNHFFDFTILATDISESVLRFADLGIYSEDKVSMLKYGVKSKYFTRGTGESAKRFRITPEIRNKVIFRKFNLLTPDYSVCGKFDIIFCRNVLIYFEREIQNRVIQQFCKQLNPGGYLFLGHSESIAGFSLPLRSIRPTIYLKTGGTEQSSYSEKIK